MSEVKNLKMWRMEKGYGQKDLERESGVSQDVLSFLERGEKKREGSKSFGLEPKSMHDIARALGIQILQIQEFVDLLEPLNSLKSLRYLKGLKQGEVAEQTGLIYVVVSQAESGKRFSKKTMKVLADFYGLEPYQIKEFESSFELEKESDNGGTE